MVPSEQIRKSEIAQLLSLARIVGKLQFLLQNRAEHHVPFVLPTAVEY